MATTLDDLDRRVTVLELAQSAKGENAVARIEQKVDAMHRVIAESEQRTDVKIEHLRADLRATEQRLDDRISAAEQRLDDRISATERRLIDTLNDRFDQVMTVLDRIANPPR
jgi:phosphoglycerate-specific signal transduction histidine kinase